MADALRWLLAADLLWIAFGAIAYATPTTLMLGTAIASAAALPGLHDLRLRSRGRDAVWAERAVAGSVGTWVLMAVLIILPYVASEGGLSLWESRGFAGLGLVVASLGMLWWNVAAWLALAGERTWREVLLYGGVHMLALAGALVAMRHEAARSLIDLRGQEIHSVDLAIAPLAVALAGLVWVVALQRAGTHRENVPST